MLPWHEFDRLVGESERVLLTTHVRPDGDALGSELAMADLLTQKGKEVEILNPSSIPARYRFLDPEGARIHALKDNKGGPANTPDLVVILDTGTWSQLAGLADFVRDCRAAKVVIDHHASQDDLGAVRLVDVRASACGMLVYEAMQQLGVELTPASATALFVAIAMDTGWFHHDNASPEVFETIGRLVAAGARPHDVYRELFEKNSVERLRLLCTMLERFALSANDRLAYSYVLQHDIRAAGAHPMDTEDFIDYLMSVAGVETALLFIEQKGGGTKVSLRTRSRLDCSRLAEQFGGGGHRPAAGATLDLPVDEARERVLAATERAMARL